MSKNRVFMGPPKCIINGEKIIAIYITGMGYWKVVDARYNNSPETEVYDAIDGNYLTFKVTEYEYVSIRTIMFKRKVEYQKVADGIDRLEDCARDRETSDYRIFDSLIFGEDISQNERENAFIERLFRDIT